MRVYVDTNIFCSLLEDNRNRINDDQLDSLEKLVDRDDIELVTSEKLLEEVSATKDERRKKKLRILFKLILKIRSAPFQSSLPASFGCVPFGAAPFGGGIVIVNPKFQKIRKFFDQNDSEHIFTATERNCDVFLTLDNKSILKKYKNNFEEINKEIAPMKMGDPIMLAKLLKITKK